MNKFKKNTVSVDTMVKEDGMTKIYDLLFEEGLRNATRIDLAKIAGGRERVNAQGKMTKRIKRNLRRDHNITLSDKTVQQIGNIMDQNSLSAREYIVEYTGDLDGTIGKFGDRGSCFKRGGEYRNNLLAMQDHGAFDAVRVYKANGNRLGRAWAYNAHGGATVLFNGYGIPLDKIAILAARLEGKEPRIVTVCSDVFINDECKCYAIGGDKTRYEFHANVDGYDDDDDQSWCSLCDCSVPYDDLYNIGTDSLCFSCYNNTYQTCGHCGDHCRRTDRPLHRVILRGGVRHICERCLKEHYRQCDECGDYHRYDAVIESGQHIYCNNCAVKLGAVACSDCHKWAMPDQTSLIQFSNKEYTHDDYLVCESCRIIYYECDTCGIDLPYQTCPTCDGETVARTPCLDFDIIGLESWHAQARHDCGMAALSVKDANRAIRYYTKNPECTPDNAIEVQKTNLNDAQIRVNLAEIRRNNYRTAIVRAREYARIIYNQKVTI